MNWRRSATYKSDITISYSQTSPNSLRSTFSDENVKKEISFVFFYNVDVSVWYARFPSTEVDKPINHMWLRCDKTKQEITVIK